MKLIRRLVIFIMILVFIFGLGVLLYPYVKGHLVDNRIQIGRASCRERV